jgi:hypothetical protein
MSPRMVGHTQSLNGLAVGELGIAVGSGVIRTPARAAFLRREPPCATSIEQAAKKLVPERPQMSDAFLNYLAPRLQVAWRRRLFLAFFLLARVHSCNLQEDNRAPLI